jgi:Fe2+ or Zn2+ uptake regulation protein
MRTPAELTVAFRARGLKLTPQRQAIFGHLHGNTGHPTAESVHAAVSARMPGISLRTVYQTLNDLAAMGELVSVDLGGAARFDPNVSDHHHLICDACGVVYDVELDTSQLVPKPSALRTDGTTQPNDGIEGFTPERTTVVVHGTCAKCQSSTK